MLQFRNSSYDLLLFGPHPPPAVRFQYDSQDRIIPEPVRERQKRGIIENLKRSGKNVQILPLYHFRSLREDPAGIILELGHTDFGEYLLCENSRPGWNAAEPEMRMSCPLSISAVTESSDHFLMMGYRSAAVVSHAGKIQTLPGGYIHPPDLIPGTVENELREELAVNIPEIAEVSVTGLARIHPSGKPEILLHIRLNIPLSEIFSRRGVDRWEFSGIFTVPATRDAVADFFASSGIVMAPASHAALAAYASHMFGIGPDTWPVADR